MELSKEILKFLHWLDSKSLPFEAELLKDIVMEPEELEYEDLRKHVEARLIIRKVVSKYVKSKATPMIESVEVIERLLDEFIQISNEMDSQKITR